MSIYVMTLGDLAKKRGQPVGEFVKKVQEAGFEAGSHAKKLTQSDLDRVIYLLDGGSTEPTQSRVREDIVREVTNPNVLMVKTDNGNTVIAFVEATMSKDGTISVEVIESREEGTIGETLLEFRKQLGMKLGVN